MTGIGRVLPTLLALSCRSASPSAPVGNGGQNAGALVALPSMHEPRAAHTATTLLDGRVLIVGGLASNATASAELFDPTTRRFSATASLRTPRASHTATLLADGRVLIAGGYNGTWLASTEIYD